ncbi:MAG TPA: hypothetical protein VH040_02145 [Usitatibacter sp.]|nr:hypothetical protein [Usitatibacter sp.]
MSLARAAARVLFVSAISVCAFAQKSTPSPALRALRVEMLTERVAKLHAQVGEGILAGRSRRELGQALQDLDAAIASLAPPPQDREVRDAWAVLAILGAGYHDWALRPATRESARRLRSRAEELAWMAAKLARGEAERSRGTARGSAARALTAAVLAERIGKARLWMRWDVGDASLERELRESNENLHRLLATLHEAPVQPDAAADAIRDAQTQLGFMDDAQRELDATASSPRPTEFVAKTADHIAESMERAAEAYDAVR